MKVCILGSGAYGLALASIFINNGLDVCMYTHSKESAKALSNERCTSKLPNYKIDDKIKFTYNLRLALKNAYLVVLATPASSMNEICAKMSKYISKDMFILIATKGIENDTYALLTEVVQRHITSNKIAVISGPTFAADITKKMPVGFSLASSNLQAQKQIKKMLENDYVKVRETSDVVGVEVCGAIKNVMAIASGILSGMDVSDSTKALFLTESLNDIKELIDALGGNKKTILSFAGFGDILMTCTSKESRNYTYGYLIGSKSLIDANKYASKTTIEGLYTLKSIKELINKDNINVPIINLIDDIIIGTKDKEELLSFIINK